MFKIYAEGVYTAKLGTRRERSDAAGKVRGLSAWRKAPPCPFERLSPAHINLQVSRFLTQGGVRVGQGVRNRKNLATVKQTRKPTNPEAISHSAMSPASQNQEGRLAYPLSLAFCNSLRKQEIKVEKGDSYHKFPSPVLTGPPPASHSSTCLYPRAVPVSPCHRLRYCDSLSAPNPYPSNSSPPYPD